MPLYCLNARRGARFLVPLLILAVLMSLSLLVAVPARAGGGIAMSGSFYRQQYELMPGESLSTPDTYVVVFNNSDADMHIKMSTSAPEEVEIVLDALDFVLAPQTNRKIGVAVNVGLQAVAGNYNLLITAEASPEGGGIKITTASQQQAKLTIFGEAGEVKITTSAPDGQPLAAVVKLTRKAGGQDLPSGYSNTGEIEKRLGPGDYKAQAYYKDIMVAEESFNLAANEVKSIELKARTVYSNSFEVVPYYNNKDRELSLGKIQYTLTNLYQPLKDVEAILLVSFEGSPLEEISILSLGTLDTGSMSGSYTYIPAEGWIYGNYTFRIEVRSAGVTYAVMAEKQFEAGSAPLDENGSQTSTPAPSSSTPAASATVPATSTNTPAATGNTPPASGTSEGGGGSFPLIIGGIIAAVVIVAGAGWLFVRRKKQ